MAKIHFDINKRPEIEAGKYEVVTRLDTPVKILCYDARGKYPIAGLVRGDESDCAQTWRIDGTFDGRNESSYDLFLVSAEPELSEFEKEYIRLYNEGYADGQAGSSPISDDNLKEYAAELLALARKELQPEIDAEVEKAYKNTDRMQYEKGREDALKDLPRWKKANGKERFNERLIVLAGNNDLLCTNYAEEGEYYISFSDLEKLPKEE